MAKTGSVHRVLWRLGGKDAVLYAKVFRNRDLLHAAKSLVRRSRARFAWDGCLGLAARGFATAEPLLYEERRALGLVHVASLFVTSEIEGAPWAEAFEKGGSEDLLLATARWVGLLHRAGADHRALQPKNLFVREGGEIVPIEYDRVRFVRRVSRENRAKALGQLVHSYLERLPPGFLDRLVAAYLEAAGEPASAWRRLEDEALAYARFRRDSRLPP